MLRSLRGEDILAAHSAHACQVVRRAGRPVVSIVAEVAAIGVVASALAIVGPRWGAPYDLAAFLAGGGLAAASVIRMRRQARAARN